MKKLYLILILLIWGCGSSDVPANAVSITTTANGIEPIVPTGVECDVDFKDAKPPFKVGQPYRVKLSTTRMDAADAVLASTNGSTTNYEARPDGYNYVITASRPGVVKLLVFHKIEVGENPLCVFEYAFEGDSVR